MKSISFVCEHLGKGGAERVMSILIRNYVNAGFHVQLVLLYENLIEYPIPESVERVFLDFGRSHSPREILSRRRKMRASVKGDTVVTFLYGAIRDTVFSLYGAGKRIVISDRSDPANEPAGRIRRCVRTLSYYFTDAIVFQTKEAKAYFPKGIQKKGCIIPNPVSASLPFADGNHLDKTIIAAGRFDSQKNFPLLIRAFARLSAEYTDYKLQICGRGYLEEELRSLVQSLGISDKVEFPGFVQNISERMKTASIYVSSSNYEGISNSMLEAMAIGVPTVCTDCPVGGAKETIVNNVNGILVPVGDEDALYHAMKRILSDRAFAMKLANESKKIRESLSEEAIFQKWLEVTKGSI